MATGRPDYTGREWSKILNATLDVDASGSTIDANITNATIDVGQSGAWTVDASGSTIDANITNASVDVAQSGDWTITGTTSVAIDQTGTNNTIQITGTPSVQFDTAQEVTFPSAQAVTIDSGTVEATFPSAQDVTITAATAKIDIFSTGDNVEQHKISVDDTVNTQNWTNAIKSFIFYNDGPNPCHINFGADATTNHFIIRARQTFGIDLTSTDTRFICASGESCTIYALGMYD